MKKTISVLLSVLLSMSSIQISFANTNGNMSNFKEIKSYAENQFADVSTNDWFAENVKKAYELGLVSGTSEITFSPKSDITIAETITLASRLHSIYVADDYTFNSSTPWYQSYVDYAVENKIITKNQFNNYSSPAKRIDFAVILEKALPDSCLNEINTVDDNMIPDVKKTLKNYEAVYKLYRAGIIVGNDNIGTFAPETTIDRASVATIISRMALPAMRSAIELKKTPVEKISLKETETIGMGANKKLNAVVYPENATNKELQWTSSNTSIATVDNGTVTAIKTGEVTITCTAENGVKAKCTVTIAPYLIEATQVGVYVNGEYIEPLGVITIPVGEPVQLEAQPLPQKANSNNDVTWSFTGSSSYLSLTPDGEILGKVVRDELRINAYLPNGQRTLFYVNVKDISWNCYPGTKVPTYTYITGAEQVDMWHTTGTYIYEYNSESDISKYHTALIDKGFTVCDYEEKEGTITTYYDIHQSGMRSDPNDRGKLICKVSVDSESNEVRVSIITRSSKNY